MDITGLRVVARVVPIVLAKVDVTLTAESVLMVAR